MDHSDDCTDQFRLAEAQAKIVELEGRMRGLELALQLTRVVVMELGRDLRRQWVCNSMTGYSSTDLVNKTSRDVLLDEDAQALDAFLTSAVAQGTRQIANMTLRSRRTGEATHFALIAEPKRDEKGAIVGAICAAVDVTEQELREEETKAAHAEAARALAEKSTFLASLTHDLRQPLQAVGFLYPIVEQEAHSTGNQRLITAVEHLGQGLRAGDELIMRTMDFASLEAGSIIPRIKDFPIQPILDEKARDFANLAEAKGLRLRIFKCRHWVRSDPVLLKRILRNLVSNAIKYTEEGGVLVGCRRHGDHLRLEVVDTGMGIPQDKLKLIFDDFYRMEDVSASHDGIGLGLSVVAKTAQVLGHPIGVRSRSGKGSCFWVAIPLANTDVSCIHSPG